MVKKVIPARDLVEMTTLLRTFIAMETVPYTIEKTEEAIRIRQRKLLFFVILMMRWIHF